MTTPWSPVDFYNTSGKAPVVLICENASNFLPNDFGPLGLSEAAEASHAAWDIGALNVARKLAEKLDAPLVSGGASRLLYDCNRPFGAADSVPQVSEAYDIPGNVGLSEQKVFERHQLIHEPFHCTASALVAAHARRFEGPIAVVTIHSFTPVYNGVPREVELGFLYHKRPDLSEEVLRVVQERGRYRAALNSPYSAEDGVTHTLKMHGDDNGFDGAMIEIRNDLISDEAGAVEMSENLSGYLQSVLINMNIGQKVIA